ncbi:MAG: polyprenyl synthetase family protein [Alphaproteobacteria bacterium]
MNNLKEAMNEIAEMVEAELKELIFLPETPERKIKEAMRYAVLNGGKRLRPFLLITCARLFNVDDSLSVRAAAALEILHSYSLVHDDLPAMDNDDLRRGLPTVHKKYDEATAILAGDGLLTKAFEILSDKKTHPDANVRCRLVNDLALAAGGRGMVAGQMLDLLAAELSEMTLAEITRLQQLKTGRLISYACEAGAVMGGASRSTFMHLKAYARDIGLAFQIADDILDVTGDEKAVGKALGKDKDHGKATFVSLLGLEEAKQKAQDLVEQACSNLDIFGERAYLLRDVAKYIIERKS